MLLVLVSHQDFNCIFIIFDIFIIIDIFCEF